MPGLLYPVVCAAPLSKEIMDRFIYKNGVDDDEWNCVFVDNIDDYYYEASLALTEDDSNPNSPFINKTPQECHDLLLRLRDENESEILTDYFAIMDERSTQDDTVLLVTAVRDLGGENEVLEYPSVRATSKASALALMLYHSGHNSVGEDAERAGWERDGVYRGIWSKVK